MDPERRHDVVINLQGDMPFVDPAAVRHVLEPLDRSRHATSPPLANADRRDEHDRTDPNVVKAVIAFDPDDPSSAGRSISPARPLYGPGPVWHQSASTASPAPALERFAAAPPCPLEQRERLEQLRALELGMSIGVRVVDAGPFAVDTPADLEKARRILEPAHERRASPADDRSHHRLPGRAGRQLPRGLPAGLPGLEPLPCHLRGRVRGGEDRHCQLAHDPGGELDRRPGGRRAPPAAPAG